MTNAKYRSWISSIQKFVYFYNGSYSHKNENENNLFNWENAQQFIGMFDKDRVAIYEGDIVTTSTRKWVIEKREDNEFCGFLPVEVGLPQTHGYLSTFIRYDLLEVVGNIYEHSHLLEVKK